MDTVGRLFKVIEWFGHEDLDNSEYISPISLDSLIIETKQINDIIIEDDEGDIF